MASYFEKLGYCCGVTKIRLRLQCKEDVVRCLKGNGWQKCRFADDVNCLIKLVAFVKEKAVEYHQSMVDSARATFVRIRLKSTRHDVRKINIPHTKQCTKFSGDV